MDMKADTFCFTIKIKEMAKPLPHLEIHFGVHGPDLEGDSHRVYLQKNPIEHLKHIQNNKKNSCRRQK